MAIRILTIEHSCTSAQCTREIMTLQITMASMCTAKLSATISKSRDRHQISTVVVAGCDETLYHLPGLLQTMKAIHYTMLPCSGFNVAMGTIRLK